MGIRPANLPAMTSSLYNRRGLRNNDMCAAYSPRGDCRTVSSNQYVLKMWVAAVFPTEPNPCLRGCGVIQRTVLNATVYGMEPPGSSPVPGQAGGENTRHTNAVSKGNQHAGYMDTHFNIKWEEATSTGGG
jgi:hypothetical protein